MLDCFRFSAKKRNAAIDKVRRNLSEALSYEKMVNELVLIIDYLEARQSLKDVVANIPFLCKSLTFSDKIKCVQLSWQISNYYEDEMCLSLSSLDEGQIKRLSRISVVFASIFGKTALATKFKSVICDYGLYCGTPVADLFEIILKYEMKVKDVLSVIADASFSVEKISTRANDVDDYAQGFFDLNRSIRDIPASLGINEASSYSDFYINVKPAIVEMINLSKIDSITKNFREICESESFTKSAINIKLRKIDESLDRAKDLISESKIMHLEFAKDHLTDQVEEISIETIKDRLRFYKELSNSRHTSSAIATLRNAITQLIRLGLSAQIKKIMSGDVLADDIKQYIMYSYYNHCAETILSEHPNLSKFLNENKESIRNKFAENDKDLIMANRLACAHVLQSMNISKTTSKNKKVSELSGDDLLQHIILKPTCRVKIRDVVTRAGKSLQNIKPCFMMSPLTVAKYLPLGSIDFDVVIIDEASQVRPEDSLSALIRGTQYVIVGDSRQLEPTNFFAAKDNEDEEDEEETLFSGSKSVLDAFKSISPSVQLGWHYRSKHQSLISFSNQMYYGGNLTIFPSPNDKNDKTGVIFNYVENGFLINRTNRNEAEKVVDYVLERLDENPLVSIGVVAMNSDQSRIIQDILDMRSQKSPEIRYLLQENAGSEEPLFIKNLESVQGDERDCIVISVSYGKSEETSMVSQRFQQFNKESGWKRLNVLLTRARECMVIYSSILSSDINYRKDGTLAKGVGDLKSFLDYAENGKMPIQVNSVGGQVENDFEKSIKDYIERLGFQCDAQVGVSGYFIDLAVKHPTIKGKYLMAVECDGATYHNSRSARDRDRLRQAVLEKMGWEVMRVWSTDWFNDPDRAIKHIVQRLAILKSSA